MTVNHGPIHSHCVGFDIRTSGEQNTTSCCSIQIDLWAVHIPSPLITLEVTVIAVLEFFPWPSPHLSDAHLALVYYCLGSRVVSPSDPKYGHPHDHVLHHGIMHSWDIWKGYIPYCFLGACQGHYIYCTIVHYMMNVYRIGVSIVILC